MSLATLKAIAAASMGNGVKPATAAYPTSLKKCTIGNCGKSAENGYDTCLMHYHNPHNPVHMHGSAAAAAAISSLGTSKCIINGCKDPAGNDIDTCLYHRHGIGKCIIDGCNAPSVGFSDVCMNHIHTDIPQPVMAKQKCII